MKAYELMLIMRPTLDDEAREGVLEKIRAILTADGGTIDSEEVWGKRRLAHEIDHTEEGDYQVVLFHAEAATVAELDRVLNITDQVLRFMVVRRDDLA
ncbi:MAG TPA: 30S ribosomal protein S6 [Coriobacteriia bacterium]|mgnify:FL=1|uniref:30S ribosomal protein S6 n=1 Tax=Anaerosoma tenue TaxID=2933588 RepID=UPI00076C6BEE|nr:30S ribosomal protein S6 [Anaerosoma tenue]KUK48444.1 MAG: 30S ribosomal protein S6 [Actinobacteria bacterium 66_15]MCK8115141.1 30S ribosomal protein S6 [Anaerosoma tenue]HAL29622.1 30S ribosomal protein S6 [Coriobacteriia bacterium]HHJ99073.1 30S ribosomal protein S6 [Actinomycetota bacterium]